MNFQHGTLALDYKSFRVTDGIEYYRVLSPALLFRLLYKKRKRDRVCGSWLILSGLIIWFRRERYYNEARISHEKNYYTREIINKCR